jgi:hypothetical protein
VTDIVSYWSNDLSLNYGIVVDNNRGEPSGGGYWNRMKYYSTEAANGLEPYLKIYIKD